MFLNHRIVFIADIGVLAKQILTGTLVRWPWTVGLHSYSLAKFDNNCCLRLYLTLPKNRAIYCVCKDIQFPLAPLIVDTLFPWQRTQPLGPTFTNFLKDNQLLSTKLATMRHSQHLWHGLHLTPNNSFSSSKSLRISASWSFWAGKP